LPSPFFGLNGSESRNALTGIETNTTNQGKPAGRFLSESRNALTGIETFTPNLNCVRLFLGLNQEMP